MDQMARAAELKGMLLEFAKSSRFDREFDALLDREFPGRIVTDENRFILLLDHFALQHRLPSGTTVVDSLVASHRELDQTDKEILLGWKDVVEGVFEVRAKDDDAVVLFNHIDELTYRTRSNMGRTVFKSVKRGMFVIVRLVPLGEDWLVSGNLSVFRREDRDRMLVAAAEAAMQNPEMVFRNEGKLAEARKVLAEQHAYFVETFGTDLICVPGGEVSARAEEFYRAWVRKVQPDRKPDADEGPLFELPEEVTDTPTVAIFFDVDEGLAFYPDFDLLEDVFGDPKLAMRQEYREELTGFLRDPELSPEPLRRLARRDQDKASAVFGKLLKKRGFTWADHGEALLRKHKPGYFDGSRLPRNVMLSETLADALRRAPANT